jgi:hypothetical protein
MDTAAATHTVHAAHFTKQAQSSSSGGKTARRGDDIRSDLCQSVILYSGQLSKTTQDKKIYKMQGRTPFIVKFS